MGNSGTITDVTNAIIRQRTDRLEGIVASTPALLITDGKNTQYACDVQISLLTSDGKVNQTQLDLYGVPGGMHFVESDTTTIGNTLRNVPIANNNGALVYAAIGMPVVLTRTTAGQWQITGFSQQIPGTKFRYEVDLASQVIGPITNLTYQILLLTLGQLALYGGGWGVIPFGAYGIFIGGVFQGLAR